MMQLSFDEGCNFFFAKRHNNIEYGVYLKIISQEGERGYSDGKRNINY